MKQRHQEHSGAAAHNHCYSAVDRLLIRTDRFSGNGLINNGQEQEVDRVSVGEYSKGENFSETRKKVSSRGHWKPPEDSKLRELVAIYGPQNWNFIAEKLEGRSGKSCRLRWYNQLHPKINKRGFTEEEDEKLMEAHRIYGNKWAFISRLFPGRTDNAVKNQWHVLMSRKYRKKTKSYVKRKYSSDQPLLERRLMEECSNNTNDLQLQNGFGQEVSASNYDNFIPGWKSKSWNMTRSQMEDSRKNMLISTSPYSPGLSSQISFAGSISPSPLFPDQYQNSIDFPQNSTTPTFIDFLGVGANI